MKDSDLSKHLHPPSTLPALNLLQGNIVQKWIGGTVRIIQILMLNLDLIGLCFVLQPHRRISFIARPLAGVT